MSTQPNCPYGLRPGIAIPPKFMRDLPIDRRGYCVPWFVEWINGEPEFRAADSRKLVRAINENLCWTCGQPLYRERIFVIGPMCAINRISSEPPSHRECAEYSAKNCPFLSKPQMVRRKNGLPEQIIAAPGMMIERNPGVTLLWYTRHYRLINVKTLRAGMGQGVLFQIGRPFCVDWYAEGRPATRAEVMESIETGYPTLRKVAEENDGPEGVQLLEIQLVKALRLVPR